MTDMYYQMCTTLHPAALQAAITEGEFSTIAVDKTVEKPVRMRGERCYAWVATLRL